MRTTLELPDELARRIKIRAAERNQKLKDTIANLLELGLANAPGSDAPYPFPEPVQLRDRGPLKVEEIEAAIAAGRE